MQGIRANILNGRPAPCEHDRLPVARIGTVQPHGVLMVVVPETGAVEHVSANVEDILGVPVRNVLGQQPTVCFSDPESNGRILEILRPGRRFFDNPTMLFSNGKRFEAICHFSDNRVFIEIEPYWPAEHDYATMVGTAIDAISRTTTVQGLYDASARMMHFVTKYDRVKLYKFVSHGHGVVVAEHHAADTKLPTSFLGYHFSATDIPETAKEILLTGKSRQKPTQSPSVPLMTRGADGQVRESGNSVDMTDCWLRGIHPCDNGYNKNLGVGSNIIFPVCLDSSLWGLFVVHHKDEKFLNYDSRVVIEQLTMMFISRLIELEAVEARIPERQRLGMQMLSALESGQELLATLSAARNAGGSMVSLHAMQAASRHLAALAPTYVSSNGVDFVMPGRPEDKFSSDLLRMVDADGAAVVRAGRGAHVHLIGSTPDPLAVRGLCGLFGSRLPGFSQGGWRVFATDALGDHAPVTDDMKDKACGLLAVPIGEQGDMILWFRREQVVDATWAGRPPTEAERHSETMFRARNDFVAHKAPLGGASRPWYESEVLLAAQFAAAVAEQWQKQMRASHPAPAPMEPMPSFGIDAMSSPQPAEPEQERSSNSVFGLNGSMVDTMRQPAGMARWSPMG